jgi:hypothetical protein
MGASKKRIVVQIDNGKIMTAQAQIQLDQNGRCRKSNKRIETRTHNNRFGNRLADGRTIGYKSISAIVTA